MKAGVDTRKQAIRDAMAAGCGPSPLCAPCGFASKRVPDAWKHAMPGTPYEPATPDPLTGKRVVLRGDEEYGSRGFSTVLGPATPIGPSLLQWGRTSKRRECEGAVMVKTPLGVVTPVTRSVVRERLRRAEKPGRATCYCAGLPWPHREASSPLCEKSGGGLAELAELERDAFEGSERDERRFMAAAARASKRENVETVDDARAALRELEAAQAELYQRSEARRMEPKKDYKARLAAAKRAVRAAGWKL